MLLQVSLLQLCFNEAWPNNCPKIWPPKKRHLILVGLSFKSFWAVGPTKLGCTETNRKSQFSSESALDQFRFNSVSSNSSSASLHQKTCRTKRTD